MTYFYPVIQVKEKILMKPFPWQMKQWRQKHSLWPSILWSCVLFGRNYNGFKYCLFSNLPPPPPLCFSNFKVFLQVKKTAQIFSRGSSSMLQWFPWLQYVWLPWGRQQPALALVPLTQRLQLRAESGGRVRCRWCTMWSNSWTQKCLICNMREV